MTLQLADEPLVVHEHVITPVDEFLVQPVGVDKESIPFPLGLNVAFLVTPLTVNVYVISFDPLL